MKALTTLRKALSDPFLCRLIELRSMPHSEYLKTPEWEEIRKAALARSGYACQLCNASKVQLDAHHRVYERIGCERDSDVIVLCNDCHRRHHETLVLPRRNVNAVTVEQAWLALVEEMPDELLASIINHQTDYVSGFYSQAIKNEAARQLASRGAGLIEISDGARVIELLDYEEDA
jgi:hypothetical protein